MVPERLALVVVPVDGGSAGPSLRSGLGDAAGSCTARGGRFSSIALPPLVRQGWDASTYRTEESDDYLVFYYCLEWAWAPLAVCGRDVGKGGGFFDVKEAFL